MPTKNVRILFLGDIVGKAGRKAVVAAVPSLREELKPDLVIANAENLAHGIGITPKTLNECQQAGIDFFTSGNHVFKKPQVEEILSEKPIRLIRPDNFPGKHPGTGHTILPVGDCSMLVINLNGQVFIEEKFSNPFHALDVILAQYSSSDYDVSLVDFHAEATSEKVAFGWHADGRISAVVGTHTHVPTADQRILTRGTAFVSDVGMVGHRDSVIGVDKDVILNNFLEEEKGGHQIPETGPCILNSMLLELSPITGKDANIARIDRVIDI